MISLFKSFGKGLLIGFLISLTMIFVFKTIQTPSHENKKILYQKSTPNLSHKSQIMLAINHENQKSSLIDANTTHYTQLVGSTDEPTIDGGIVNVSSGQPMPAQIPNYIFNKNVIDKKTLAQNLTAPTIPTPFANNVTQKINGTQNTNQANIQNNELTIALDRAIHSGELQQVLKISQAQHLPPSVALIPVLESGYQNTDISPKGALGAWQLMPNTAKDLGLNPQDAFSFNKATPAALDFLSQLHQQFGRWDLAFAAYNAGPAAVANALKNNPNPKNINQLALPIETKNYVNHLYQFENELTNA